MRAETTSAPTKEVLRAFPCELVQVSTSTPTTVHHVRPSDVKVVASLGDSITAAFGAESKNILTLFTEYRGVSWSGGGQSDYTSTVTMPNILKQFNPKLYGYATGKGGPSSANAVFNIAVTGAVAEDLPSQARQLVEMLSDNPAVNYTEDWKVITLWIGGNDLCAVCDELERYSAEKFQAHLMTTLDILQQIPRVFVNLVQIMDITQLFELNSYGICNSYQKTACPCVQRSPETRFIVSGLAREYQEVAVMIGNIGRFQTDTFAVNVQPFFVDSKIPMLPDGSPDFTYFAPDCFHFSAKAHAEAAMGLWNNMLEAQGSKDKSWHVGQQPRCPTEQAPFLCTPTNLCGADSGVRELKPTGGEAPAPTLTVEQRTMLGIALVLIVAVPIALFVYRRVARRRGYSPISPSVNSDSATTVV